MKLASFFSFVFLTVSLSLATATTHTITFGGLAGNSYSPKTLEVNVGDVIIWSGDFSFHPLTSDDLPPGAPAFDVATGTSFSYTVTELGTYTYHCTVHGGAGVGMWGQFTAVAASVGSAKLAGAAFLQNYPNPAVSFTNISFGLSKPADIELKLFTLDGKEIAQLANGRRSEGAYTVPVDVTALPAGSYRYRLIINGEAITRELIVTK